MKWRRVVDSTELIIYEGRAQNHSIKIEARRNDESRWDVFKTRVENNKSTLLREFSLGSKKEFLQLINSLKKDNSTVTETSISLKRIFKEDYVEKWLFSVGKGPRTNVMFIHYEPNIAIDVILSERYRFNESDIIGEIEEKLGLAEMCESATFSVYYFKNYTKKKKENRCNMVMGSIEFDFEKP